MDSEETSAAEQQQQQATLSRPIDVTGRLTGRLL